MAWFRAGGGGIPSSLKSDMNDVFNKKFGTVLQDYPPEDWPGTVNLMGPLPEKNVSGSVVTFSDGADAVKLKSCAVTIAPNLDGVSSVDVVQTGGNFIELYTRDSNAGVSYSINNDGSLHREGTASGNSFNNGNVSNYASCPYKFKAGTYTLSVNGNIDNNTYVQLGIKTASGASVQAQGIAGKGAKTFTVNEDFGAWYYCKLNSGVPVDDDVYIWINAGETSLPYDKKIEPTTHTAALGRTIYGGEVDVVNGTAEPTNILDSSTFANGNFQTISEQSTHNVVTQGFLPIKGNTGYVYSCTTGTNGVYFRFFDSTQTEIPDSAVNAYNATLKTFTTPSNAIYIRIMWYQSATTIAPQDIIDRNVMIEEGSTASAYSPYFEPFTFTPVPIISRLGDNTMWGDGDLSVTYRRDIDLALAQ